MGNPVTLRYPGGPDSSMVEHLVQFHKGLGSSPGPVTFHAAIHLPSHLLFISVLGRPPCLDSMQGDFDEGGEVYHA